MDMDRSSREAETFRDDLGEVELFSRMQQPMGACVLRRGAQHRAMKLAVWMRLHWSLVLLLAITGSSAVWPMSAGWPVRLALGWDVGVGLFLIVAVVNMVRAGSTAAIRDRAAALDEAGPAVLPLALLAAVASVVVVIGDALGGAGEGQARSGAVLALATVALSWTFTHVIFALHYAHAFHGPAQKGKGARGGLIFPGDDSPDYWDFLHFALIIGVASQTADVQIADKALRRLSTLHSVAAFLFNTVIVALAVNMAVSLLG
jgi:uncharacterized membrane protein